ncbi:unnamed protein product [Somion occarium]|uniref:Uncharacterized protein n=1 Tax=Somion occarium TaxID=3059160 RepID=A0ABP1D8T4_9APHY
MPRFSSSVDSHYPSSMESLLEPPSGSQRVKYRGAGSHSAYDFSLDTEHRPIDVSLVLPHYRAKNQPIDHRLSMYVGNDSSESIKVKVCRSFTPSRPTKFHLEVSFSAGFTNRIMKNVCLTQSRRPSVVSVSSGMYRYSDIYITDANPHQTEKWGSSAEEDKVIVHTLGTVTFRMWDIHRGEPEAWCKEACKRMFGLGWCAKRSNEVEIDWDFLLED